MLLDTSKDFSERDFPKLNKWLTRVEEAFESKVQSLKNLDKSAKKVDTDGEQEDGETAPDGSSPVNIIEDLNQKY